MSCDDDDDDDDDDQQYKSLVYCEREKIEVFTNLSRTENTSSEKFQKGNLKRSCFKFAKMSGGATDDVDDDQQY